MPLSVEELIDKAKDQRKRNRVEEALISALSAVESDHVNSDAWWEIALCRIVLKDTRNAIIALKKTVEFCPYADSAWGKLGTFYLDNGDQDEAKDSFLEALDCNPSNTEALEGMSKIYSHEDIVAQDEEETSVLERIESLSYLDSNQLNRFGIIHYRAGRHHESIKYWKLMTAEAIGPAGRYNLGLAYNLKNVSQDADAIDMWRMTLRHWGVHEKAKTAITRLLPRMLELAKKSRSQGETLLPKEKWYEIYLNPFELLNPSDELGYDDFDAKTIQKLKKRLLQEIELEDGVISWLPDIKVDKSRAIGLCDELMSDTKLRFHWQVYSNKPLLKFLSRGSHEHFLVHESISELDTIELIEDASSGFQEWLCDIFTPQFNRVLCKAIDTGNLVILECLLDGRRWVLPSHIDQCFQGARQAIDRRLQPLRDANNRADDEKPMVHQVEKLLNQGNLLAIMNLLPSFFENFQNEAVNQLRGIAISSFNAHDDAGQSRQIVELAKQFQFHSASANQQIKEDVRQIEELLQQERQHESKLNFGDKRCEITKKGVRWDDTFIPATEVSTVRWGIMIVGDRAAPSYDFLMVIGSNDGHHITINWKSTNDRQKQEDLFDGLITAIVNYIVPSLIERLKKRMADGSSIPIGSCIVSSSGLKFDTKGWFLNKSHLVPWQRAQQSLNNGEVIIQDSAVSKATVSLPIRDTDNVVLLQILINTQNREDD